MAKRSLDYYRSRSGNKRARNMKYRGGSAMVVYRQPVRRSRPPAYSLSVEKKFFDSSRSVVALTAPTNAAGGEVDPATLACLNCPAQGDGETQRDGRQISMHSINIRGVVNVASQNNQIAGDTIPDVFIALVLDRQTNGAQLASEDVFSNPGGSSLLATSPFRNLEWTKRFRVLKTVKISAQEFAGSIQPVFDGTNIEQQGSMVPFSMYYDLKGMKTNFLTGQTSSVIAAVADNSLHVVAYASNLSTTPTLLYNARLRFTG